MRRTGVFRSTCRSSALAHRASVCGTHQERLPSRAASGCFGVGGRGQATHVRVHGAPDSPTVAAVPGVRAAFDGGACSLIMHGSALS